MAQSASRPPGSVHIINHTHWDREWFLTEEYTTGWIPKLIDAINEIRTANPDYRYLLDGQTLVVEDLIRTQPHYEASVACLVDSGVLKIGPLYSQPDWRIAGGELLIRNLGAGLGDVARYGGRSNTAWLVDTFGHISQAPQILSMFGVDAVYVWRGVPQLAPLFRWGSPDGTEVAAVNLFGGYRNLYGVSRTKSLAVRRLRGEHDKLAEYYRNLPIPLFDGYDLETEPEDPVSIFRELGGGLDAVELVESSPERYVQAVEQHVDSAPRIAGELLSGKYGATFPGTLSARTYLKLLHSDVEHMLHRVCEPLAALAGAGGMPCRPDLYESWNRELLRNVVHDCICGVSVDPVHERMERSYRRLLREMKLDAERSVRSLARCMQDGHYVLSTTAIPGSGSVRADGSVYEFDAAGLGLSPATVHLAAPGDFRISQVASPLGAVSLGGNGALTVGEVSIGPLEIRRDDGDAYSSEPGELVGIGRIVHAEVESASEVDAVVFVELEADWADGEMTAEMRFRFSQGRTVELDIGLDSNGTGFIAEMIFHPGRFGTVLAGMPFDVVERKPSDTELLGHEIDPRLARVLMGQREVGEVSTFPFQDFVASFDGSRSVVVHARGLRAYRAMPDGAIALPLRRSVEWLAKSGLAGRAGDAGPAMYVPGARCERKIRHQLGVSVVHASPDDEEFVALCESFRNPPIVVGISGSRGRGTQWAPVRSRLPMSSLRMGEEGPLARVYNPTGAPATLDGLEVGPRKIIELPVLIDVLDAGPADPVVQVHGLGADRGGRSRSLPDEHVVEGLRDQVEKLSAEASKVRASLDSLSGDDRHLAVHQALVIERRCQELALSVALNQLRLEHPEAEVSLPDEAVPAIAEMGRTLNDLRIQRRIYDYVAELLAHQAAG